MHSEKAWCVKVTGEKPSEELSKQRAKWQRQGGEEEDVGLWAMLRRIEAGTHENHLIFTWLLCGAWGSRVNRESWEFVTGFSNLRPHHSRRLAVRVKRSRKTLI